MPEVGHVHLFEQIWLDSLGCATILAECRQISISTFVFLTFVVLHFIFCSESLHWIQIYSEPGFECEQEERPAQIRHLGDIGRQLSRTYTRAAGLFSWTIDHIVFHAAVQEDLTSPFPYPPTQPPILLSSHSPLAPHFLFHPTNSRSSSLSSIALLQKAPGCTHILVFPYNFLITYIIFCLPCEHACFFIIS